MCGRTQQSIYKRLAKENNPLKVYAKDGADGLKIHRDALQVIYGIEKKENLTKHEVEQPRLIEGLEVEKQKEEKKEEQTATMKVIEILQKELEEQRKSNEIKDNQIMALTESLQKSQQMLDQEQKLNAMNTQRILQLEESNTHKKKKSFFDFFRKGAEQ